MSYGITPNDFSAVAKTDSEAIRLAVAAAKETGEDRVVIPRKNLRTGKNVWEIDSAILLPSDIEIVLDNCTLRQADGCFDNVFRTAVTDTEERGRRSARQRNVHLTGRGNAVIDGGVHNGLTEKTSLKNGLPHVSKNNMILFTNLESFSITGITFRDMRWWALQLVFVSEGRLRDLTFDARDNVPNQDGIDLRVGCHNITVENVTGYAGDDLIALSGFSGAERRHGYWVEGMASDISNVRIRNVIGTSVTKAVIALRNNDGILLRDIDIDGVTDLSGNGARKSAPYAVVRIGQKYYGSLRFSKMGETSRISVRNVFAAHGDAVMVNVTLDNAVFENLFLGEEAKSAFTTRSDWKASGASLRNVTVRGVFCDAANRSPLPLVELVRVEEDEYLENVRITEVSAPAERQLLHNEFLSGLTTDL
ncbi:MAG: hypothetical protein IJF73_00770 [Clostridia bacterium]|nr:hypothetical protein [Clostridia bacterium]